MAETYEPERRIRHHYADPCDVIWLTTAARLGMTVRRSPDVYATHDGHGLLTLSDRAGFDPDDTIAQMVFHEVCHWIVNGEDTFHQPDWGFDLDWTVDWREYTCQRLQAHLATRFGLGQLLASTGTYRTYYDRVRHAPLTPLDASDEEARHVQTTRIAIEHAGRAPWAPHLEQALAATAALNAVLTPFKDDYQADHDKALPLVWDRQPEDRKEA